MWFYSLLCIGNMDETPLWLDMPGETTISRVAERSVSVRTTGHDKSRFTVILAAMTDGRKLKPFIVFKGVCTIPELSRVPNVVVALSWNGRMNEALTIQTLWGRLSFQRRLLVWDAYRCHMTEKVRDHVQRHTKSDTCCIPLVNCNLSMFLSHSRLPIMSFITHRWPQGRSLSLQLAIRGHQIRFFASSG